jgi:hypothetical protein
VHSPLSFTDQVPVAQVEDPVGADGQVEVMGHDQE